MPRKYLPIIAFAVYMVVTFLLNFVGPWSYSGINYLLVLVFLFVFLSFVFFAYCIAVNRNVKVIAKKTERESIKYLRWLLVVASALLTLVITENVLRIGLPNFSQSIGTIMAETYSEKVNRDFSISVWLQSYLFVLVIFSMVGGAYFFFEISKTFRFLVVYIYAVFLINTVLYVGSQKNLGDIFIYLAGVFFLKYAIGRIKFSIKFKLLSLVSLIFISFTFMSILGARLDLWNITPDFGFVLASVDYENVLLSFVPEQFETGLIMLVFYLSSGYYGLSLALESTPVWSMGFGSSFEITATLIRWFDVQNIPLNYPEYIQAQTGWKAYANWHTIFPWFASDFTFFGSILIVSFFVYIYGRAYKSFLQNEDLLSMVIFCHLNVMLVYIPCNNQLFQTRTSIIAGLILSVAFFMRKVKWS